MATSRPLKSPDARRNNHPPRLGEWIDLPALEAPVLPAYPMAWYTREARLFAIPKYIWDLWREDPVTSQWSKADLATALELGATWHKFKPEHRLRVQTYLGLNARGRRDLRWREPIATQAVERAERAEVKRLRIVAEGAAPPGGVRRPDPEGAEGA